MRTVRRATVWLAVAALVVAGWAALAPSGRVALRTLLFMPDLMPPVSVRPLTWATAAPVRTAMRIVDPAAPTGPGWAADVYVPSGEGPFPAILVSLGIDQAPRDDPRIRKLGDGLSRLGFVVLIPANDELRAGRLTSNAVTMLVAWYRQLAARPDVDPARVGLFGVCVGASLALLAAEEPLIADNVAWVAWFGGYYRLETLIAAVVSRRQPGRDGPWAVDPLSERVIRVHLLEQIDDSLVRAGVARSAGVDAATGERTAPAPGPASARPDWPIAIAYLLGAGGESVTYDGALRAIDHLSPAVRARLAALSPARRLDRLRAPLFTMSDVGDPLIPSTETDALNAAARSLGRLARARTFDVFRHVNLDPFESPGRTAPELWRLYRHVHAIVAPALLHGRGHPFATGGDHDRAQPAGP